MSHLYVTGDVHGDDSWSKFNSKNFPVQKELTKDDYVVVLGDFGAVWFGNQKDKYFLKNYDARNFTTLFVAGNHENHELLDAMPVTEWHGGKVHKVSDSVYHLMNGQVYELCGKKIFVMGGAESSDKEHRKEGVSWWPHELPTLEEYNEAYKNLGKYGYKVDLVFTHCAPETTVTDMFMPKMSVRKLNDLTSFLDMVAQTISFKDWYFGHYHDESDKGKFHLLYNRVIELPDDNDNA